MRNPWLKKNPLMSMWLSGAHTIANSVRGAVQAQTQRHVTTATKATTNEVLKFWRGGFLSSGKPKKKSR